MSWVTKVMSHIIGVRKKSDSQKRVREVKGLGNPDLTDSPRMISNQKVALGSKKVGDPWHTAK